MTHDAALWVYCRLVGGALRLQRRRKKELLAGLRQELEERFHGREALTLKEISAEIGPYDKVADELMEAVPEEERQQYLTQQRWLSLYLIVLLLIVLAVAVTYIVFPPENRMPYWNQDTAYVTEDPVHETGWCTPLQRLSACIGSHCLQTDVLRGTIYIRSNVWRWRDAGREAAGPVAVGPGCHFIAARRVRALRLVEHRVRHRPGRLDGQAV